MPVFIVEEVKGVVQHRNFAVRVPHADKLHAAIGDGPPERSTLEGVAQVVRREKSGKVVCLRTWEPKNEAWSPWRRP